MNAVALFQSRYPDCATEIVEIPFSDPFGPVHRREVDTAVVLMPVQEGELVVGQVFSRQPQSLAVSSRHPFAKRDAWTPRTWRPVRSSASTARPRSTGAAPRLPPPPPGAVPSPPAPR